MTVVNQALALRTKLLVAEYGRKRVIAALAQAENMEFETIEREVAAVRERRSTSHRRTKTLSELLKTIKIDPRILSRVKRIAHAYENKQYLAELWRVRRFLESHGVDSSKVRTRAAALPLVVKALGNKCERELAEIEAELYGSSKGDLRIIADQILGAHKGNSGVAKDAARPGGKRE